MELSKFNKTLAELETDLDLWFYFLRHAEIMDPAALPPVMQSQPAIVQAMEELKMFAQTEVERQRYEARRKLQLDYTTAINAAKQEGEAIGEQRGEQRGEERGEQRGQLIGIIRTCETILRIPQTQTSELSGLPIEQLEQRANDLTRRAMGQG